MPRRSWHRWKRIGGRGPRRSGYHLCELESVYHLCKGPELARFKVKALIEGGLVEPTSVSLPPLPANAPATALETWALIAELCEIRTATGDTGPMPLVAPWLASLNGTDQNAIRAGKRWLETEGRIV